MLVWEIGTVPPSGIVCLELPGVSWRYFSPIAPFRRIRQVELTDSGSSVLLSARFSTAIGTPAASRPGVMLVTCPTSAPPARCTSASWVSSSASATWTRTE